MRANKIDCRRSAPPSTGYWYAKNEKITRCATVPAELVAMAPLGMDRSELEPMTIKELLAFAESQGCSEGQIDRAMEGDDPKGSVIDMLLAGEIEPAGPKKVHYHIKLKGTKLDSWGKLNLLKAAASADNDPDAQHWLGARYMEGVGVAKDERQGLLWLRRSAA